MCFSFLLVVSTRIFIGCATRFSIHILIWESCVELISQDSLHSKHATVSTPKGGREITIRSRIKNSLVVHSHFFSRFHGKNLSMMGCQHGGISFSKERGPIFKFHIKLGVKLRLVLLTVEKSCT